MYEQSLLSQIFYCKQNVTTITVQNVTEYSKTFKYYFIQEMAKKSWNKKILYINKNTMRIKKNCIHVLPAKITPIAHVFFLLKAFAFHILIHFIFHWIIYMCHMCNTVHVYLLRIWTLLEQKNLLFLFYNTLILTLCMQREIGLDQNFVSKNN